MPFQSRWPLSPPHMAVPTFVFEDRKREPAREETRLFIDAHRPASHHFTLSTLWHWSRRFAAGLSRSGLKGGNRVTLFSGNCLWTPVVLMGTIMAGGVYNSANLGFTAREAAIQFKDCEPTYILAASNCMDKAREAADAAGIDHSRLFLFENFSPLNQEHKPRDSATKSWVSLLGDARSGDQFRWQNLDTPELSSRTALLIYSSGTTGLAKGVELSHYNLISTMIQLERTTFSDTSKKNRRALCAIPFYHGLGLLYYGMLPARLGYEAYIMERYDLHSMLRYISDFQITDLLLVPPILTAMAKHPACRSNPRALASITKVEVGAAPTGLQITKQFEELWDGRVKVRQAWGMSEAPMMSIGWDENDKSTGTTTSVGELMPGLEARLLREDETEVSAFGEPGELCLRGPNVMKGYWRNPGATDTTKSSDGWLRTGDVATVDSKGKWYIVDRKKELIKVRGAQVSPAELEALLLEHPQIIDAAVVGIRTSTDDEDPKAYVVPRDRRFLSEQEVLDFVQRRVAKIKRLTGGVRLVDSIPKTAAGKILRRELRELAAKEQRQARL